MTDDPKPDADVQEQQQPGPGNPSEREAPHDAAEGDAQEQGSQRRPETEEEGLPDEPKGESLEDRLDRAAEERSGDEPA